MEFCHLGLFNLYLNLRTCMFLYFAPIKCSCHDQKSNLHLWALQCNALDQGSQTLGCGRQPTQYCLKPHFFKNFLLSTFVGYTGITGLRYCFHGSSHELTMLWRITMKQKLYFTISVQIWVILEIGIDKFLNLTPNILEKWPAHTGKFSFKWQHFLSNCFLRQLTAFVGNDWMLPYY